MYDLIVKPEQIESLSQSLRLLRDYPPEYFAMTFTCHAPIFRWDRVHILCQRFLSISQIDWSDSIASITLEGKKRGKPYRDMHRFVAHIQEPHDPPIKAFGLSNNHDDYPAFAWFCTRSRSKENEYATAMVRMLDDPHAMSLVMTTVGQIITEEFEPTYGYCQSTTQGTLGLLSGFLSLAPSDIRADYRQNMRWRPASTMPKAIDSSSSWQFALSQRLDCSGILREVFRENLLSEPQLNWNCDGQRFQDWIEADPARGTLRRFGDRLWHWSVPDCSFEMIERACFGFGNLMTRDKIQEYAKNTVK